MKLTTAQRSILNHQRALERKIAGYQWTRDVYLGGYASDIQALYAGGYLERREWQVPDMPGMMFGYEYRIRKQS